jgi:hypothetical protein
VVRQLQPGWTVAGIRNRLRDAAAGGFFSAHRASRGCGEESACVVVDEEGASKSKPGVVGGGAGVRDCGTCIYTCAAPCPVSVRGRRRRRGRFF